MIWEREFGIDAEGFTSDCISLLCNDELEEWRQRNRDSWSYIDEKPSRDCGLDDPDDYDVYMPPLTRLDLRPLSPVVSLDEARVRRDSATTETLLDELFETIYGPKETA